MISEFKIQPLRCVIAIAELGSFNAAARALHRTQPAISLSIRELEQRLGQPLFEKGAPGKLTPFGRHCLPKFRELVNTHQRLVKDIHAQLSLQSGQLEVAVVPSVASSIMPKPLSFLLANHPELQISLHDGTSEFVMNLVLQGKADFGVASLWGETRDLKFTPLLEDSIGVVCHKQHRLAQHKELKWSQLAQHAVIRNGTSRLLKDTPIESLHDDSNIYISEMISIIAMLKTQKLYTTLPRMAFNDTDTDLCFIPVQTPVVTRQIGLIQRINTSPSPAAQAMIEKLIREVRHAPPEHVRVLV